VAERAAKTAADLAGIRHRHDKLGVATDRNINKR